MDATAFGPPTSYATATAGASAPARALSLQCPLSVKPQNYDESVPHLLRSNVNAVLREIGALLPSALSAHLDESPIRIHLEQEGGYLQIEAFGCVHQVDADALDAIRAASAHCTTDPYMDTRDGRMLLVCRLHFDVVTNGDAVRALEASAPNCSIQDYTQQYHSMFERVRHAAAAPPHDAGQRK